MELRTYTINGEHLTIRDKDLYKFLWGKLRPLTEFKIWVENAVSDPDIRWPWYTLDGWDKTRNAGRFFSIEKCIELTDDEEKKEILWNLL